ncbi:EAL domain, c-di-GMP-specific phosphodiesterase class I (or its enzymatically inactive variant) [Paracoccus isoporae]|uniref:EAL domain, c-di-GMP-specific phosphodiesterase class I (Or its enzymatically inactive variant) n=1 Tax=Paracoccus isoporae TaxID=591205 RepID=A0A1G7GE86_9RHOB|nr:EAL domain-containing protein [Paracoccus isoporae]SDE86393.1 EAL domain, c-di-GMP-specific phosphodiesterase class I (or its enzymatically inactive variant) [Paracoccus isoporae]
MLILPPAHLAGDPYESLRLGLMQMRLWSADAISVPPLSVDLLRTTAECAELAAPLLGEIARQGFSPAQVMFSAADPDGHGRALAGLSRLAAAGCGIELCCMDEAVPRLLARSPTGSVRLRLPPPLLRGCGIDPDCGRMILAQLAVAERHGARSFAGQVDTRREYGFLAQIGCDVVQGDAVAPELDANAMGHYLRQSAAIPPTRGAIPRPAA